MLFQMYTNNYWSGREGPEVWSHLLKSLQGQDVVLTETETERRRTDVEHIFIYCFFIVLNDFIFNWK